MRSPALALLFAAALGLSACGEDTSKPYLVFAGGGFVFNYRLGEAFYGFVATPARALPEGSLIEARFEDPAGGGQIVVSHPARAGQLRYSFQTPPLTGIRAGRDYKVELRLIDPGNGKVYAAYSNAYRTNVDQSDLPTKPLVVGPAYTPNPKYDANIDFPQRQN
jgi:hypothetical protein